MKKAIVALSAILLLVLVGCDTSDAEKADEIEDIVGTWKRVGGGVANYCQYYDDGTYGCDRDLERVNNNTASFKGEYWFEGAQFFDKIGVCSEDGVYEIFIQSNGNLKYVLIEDNCPGRISDIVGSGSVEGDIEWAPIP